MFSFFFSLPSPLPFSSSSLLTPTPLFYMTSTLPSSPSYSSTLELIQSPTQEASIPLLLTENPVAEESLSPEEGLPSELPNPSVKDPNLEEDLSAPSAPTETATLEANDELTVPALPSPEERLSPPPSTPAHFPLNSEGDFLPEWWKEHPSLQELGKTLQKFKSPQSLAKSYAQLEKMRSRPNPEESEKWASYRHFMGIPERAEDYPFEEPKDEDGQSLCPWDVDISDCLKAKAYEWAIAPDAFQALAHEFAFQQKERYSHLQAEEQKAWKEHQQKTFSSLEKEWGSLCEHKIGQARHTLNHLCLQLGEDPKTLSEDPHMGSHPLFIRLLEYVGRSLSDAPLKGQSHQMTISSAKAEAHRMESDPSHPLYAAYIDYKHPNHKYANSLYDKLITQEG